MLPKPCVNFENLHPIFWMKKKSKSHDFSIFINKFVLQLFIAPIKHIRDMMMDKNEKMNYQFEEI